MVFNNLYAIDINKNIHILSLTESSIISMGAKKKSLKKYCGDHELPGRTVFNSLITTKNNQVLWRSLDIIQLLWKVSGKEY